MMKRKIQDSVSLTAYLIPHNSPFFSEFLRNLPARAGAQGNDNILAAQTLNDIIRKTDGVGGIQGFTRKEPIDESHELFRRHLILPALFTGARVYGKDGHFV